MTDSQAPDLARAGFRDRFGREPDGVWSAPGRINLMGEHTDYNGGLVLPCAIDRRTYVAVAPRRDRLVRVSSSIAPGVTELDLADISRETVRGWSAYPFGTAWGLGRVGVDLARVPGFEAHFVSEVPVGAGLSSSAAIECALAVALTDVWRLSLGRDALVTATHLAENEIVGAPTGTLDQSASLLAEADSALFLDCRDGTHDVVPLGLAAAGLTLLVVDTRVEHSHAVGGYAARRTSCEEAARLLGVRSLREVGRDDLERAASVLDGEMLRRVRHVVTENQRVLETVAGLRAEGPRAIGDIMVASHESLRDDFEVTVPELDAAVEACVTAGAVGARMTGGGFGGAAIALVDDDAVDDVAAHVVERFERSGFAEPAIFSVTPSGGARRD